MLKACVCCLWCLEKCLAYLNQVSNFRPAKEEHLLQRLVETRSWVFTAYLRGIIPECLHCNSNQQHQFLHLCPWRFPHPGGERPSSDGHQHSGRLCPFLRKGTKPAPNTSSCKTKSFTQLAKTLLSTLLSTLSGAHRLMHSVLWRSGSELPEGLHGLGPASAHCVCVRLPGGSLLPVCLWECGGRPLPLLRRGHEV